jgi:hypothetical protein
MGKLYDRRDLAWNTLYWQQQEQQWHRAIANGHLPASVLDEVITYETALRIKTENVFQVDDKRPSRHMRRKDTWPYEIQKERFKLLRTGQLLSNLKAWEAIFKACPKCYQETARVGGKTTDRPCADHEEGYKKAKSDVWWAGERNIEERAARGQVRTDDSPESQGQAGLETLQRVDDPFGRTSITTNPLNKWEARFQRDKAQDLWTERDARRYEVQPDYRGWLRMLLEEEELTEKEYLDEVQRLRNEAEELEFTTKALAGTNGKIRRDRHIPATQSGYTGLT